MRTLRRQEKLTTCSKTWKNPGSYLTGRRTTGEARNLQVASHVPSVTRLSQPDLASHSILSIFFVLILGTEHSHFENSNLVQQD